jgi:enoyl-CoA hydratase/carnithine racemase
MCHGFDQFILRIANMDKIVLHATSGKVISMLLNVSLACDFRIISEDTVFHNPYLDLGLVPKGGGAYFLSRKLGIPRALELLLLHKEIPARQALDLGLVDRVVPLEDLETSALEMAHRFDDVPSVTLSGVKRLLNFSLRNLDDHLEVENQELVRILESSRR